MSEVLVTISFLAVIDIFLTNRHFYQPHSQCPLSSSLETRLCIAAGHMIPTTTWINLQVERSCMMWKRVGYKVVLMTDTSHDIIILDSSQILGATQLGPFLEVERERTWERGCTLNFYFYKVQRFKKIINSDPNGEALPTGSTPYLFTKTDLLFLYWNFEFLYFFGY